MAQNNERNRDYVLCHPRNSTRENYLGSRFGFLRLNSRFHGNDRNRAFTLIELIVVMAIFTIISSITIFNYGRFSSNLIVTNLAYEAALAVRQAQVYGISVKQTKASQGITGRENFTAAYGVSFDKTDLQNFYLFSDADNDNKRYADGTEDEESFSMNGTNYIKRFCLTYSGSSGAVCNDDSNGLTSISIIFKRPDLDAKIYGFDSSGGVISGIVTKAEVLFSSGRGDKTARITVTNTGQISVDSCNKPAGASNQCP